jgi:hypothetical protein
MLFQYLDKTKLTNKAGVLSMIGRIGFDLLIIGNITYGPYWHIDWSIVLRALFYLLIYLKTRSLHYLM